MQAKIQSYWHKLEEQRLDLMGLLSQYDNSLLNKKPAPEKWSAIQVVQHLIDAEKASLVYMKKKLSYTSKIPKAGFKSGLRRFVLRLIFSLPLKFKAPSFLNEFPENTPFADITNEWASLRLEYFNFITNLPKNVVEGEIWRHQIAGKMSIAQMLDFFYDHAERHRKQIERTIEQVK